MLNQVSLMGRLVRDPELKTTQSGISVVSVTIAVDRDYGGDKKEADFIDIVAWRHTAEFVAKYFRKGSMMAVAGRLQTRRWEDKSEGKRTTVEVAAEHVYFGERKQDGAASHNDAQAGFTEMEDDDGEVPF